ncbi:MAG: ABC transporter permease [Bacteroidetes bacterium]|nr:ABC transporter permease [Bacteroidota bacterium]
MFRNYFKVAWRNLLKSKLYSTINIAGLATGMAVAMLIGLWIYDELSFDRHNTDNYERIGQVMQHVNFGSGTDTYGIVPIPLAKDMHDHYPDFQYVCRSSQSRSQVLAVGDKLLTMTGAYVDADFPKMMTLRMVSGSRDALRDMHTVLLSQSVAKALFGDADPVGKVIKFDNVYNLTVAGVYEDFRKNSSFNDYQYMGAWDQWVAYNEDTKESLTAWDSNSWQIFAQLRPGVSFGAASAKIRMARERQGNYPKYRPQFFLQPLSHLRLYMYKNGVETGRMINFVWLFGIIGLFVLLLACINFMNLSTARSERRAKEVGIRKAIGSVRRQLVLQFLSESLLVALLAFAFSLLLVQLSLPFFNSLSDKTMVVLWKSPVFWGLGVGFSLLTGLVAGSYPALYLSSFRPVKVLKGTFKAGRFASIPRRVLVTLQFTVSVVLIVGTIVVYRQIQYAKDLPVGYSRSGLIEMDMNTRELYKHAEAIRNELLNTGAATVYAQTSCPITANWGGTTDFRWKTKDPEAHPLINANRVTVDFGRAVGWRMVQGRDFQRDMATDSSAIILNEAAVRLMGLKNPVGETITLHGTQYIVIGVSGDMIRSNPFEKIAPSAYTLTANGGSTIELRLNGQLGTAEALRRAAVVFRKYNPGSPFTYQFVDKEYEKKFGDEQRIGRLATFFAVLAIFISCLGLFGLASFVAEQRTKEIGIRKVLGASLISVWRLLSKEFVALVALSLVVAMPIAYYFMHQWLQNYEYHTGIPWWVFVAAGAGALLITLLTVSYQALRAGLSNPVKSLRTE